MNLLSEIKKSLKLNSVLADSEDWIFDEVYAPSATFSQAPISKAPIDSSSPKRSLTQDKQSELKKLMEKSAEKEAQQKTLKDLQPRIVQRKPSMRNPNQLLEAKDLEEFNHQLYSHPWYQNLAPRDDHKLNCIVGSGPIQPQLMIICFQPYADDIQIKQPLAGAAGELLRNMLKAIEIEKNLSYITYFDHSINPQRKLPRDIKILTEHLSKEVALVQPKNILIMGQELSEILLHESDLKTLVQSQKSLWNIPCFATFPLHYMLHDAGWKKPTWTTLQFMKARMNER